VSDARSLGINGKFDLPPILYVTPEYNQALQQLEAAGTALRKFRSALERLSDVIRGWQGTDPVLEVYQQIFDKAVVRELSVDADTLEEIRKARYEARVPPGFLDKAKDDGGVGDLAIWLTILEAAAEAKRDVIFVTEESKLDWFHRSPDEKLFPRYELLEEFSINVPGKSFGVMTLADLLKAYGASDDVVDEVRPITADPPSRQADGGVGVFSEKHFLAALANRFQASRALVLWPESHKQPDLIAAQAGDRLGISLVVTAQEGPALIALLSQHLQRARTLVDDNTLREIAVVIVAHRLTAIHTLIGAIGESRHYPDVALVLALSDYATLRIIVNQTAHPLLRQAFAEPI
jgi:hypothetical protein